MKYLRLEKYLNVQEIESALVNLASAYPNLCELITLPLRTHEGRTCHALRIGRKPKTRCPNILFTGCVHAREWGSSEICISFAADLLEAYATNTGLQYGGKIFSNNEIRTIIENLNVIIFPDVNPDGRNWSFINILNDQRWWRKNRNPTAGVDVNRNFDFLWDYPNLFSPSAEVEPYTSTDPSSYQYHGRFPFSEPETRNVLWLFDEFPRIRWFVDIHCYSQLLLYNWGDDQNQVNIRDMNFKNNAFNSVRGIKNDTAYKELIRAWDVTIETSQAIQMWNSIKSVQGKNYSVKPAFDLYLTCGSSMDFAYSRHFTNPAKQKIFAFTIEWGTQFQPLWGEMEQIILDISSALFTCCLQVLQSPYSSRDGKTGVFIVKDNSWLVSTGGITAWQEINTSMTTPLNKLRFGDFNGDGKTDVFTTGFPREEWLVSYGGITPWQEINPFMLTPLDRLRFGDFNGDGKTDVFTSSISGFQVSYGGTTPWQQINSLSPTADQLRFGDFNGDGKTDVFTSRFNKWLVSYGGSTPWQQINQSSTPLEELRFGDFNGDGITDVFTTQGFTWLVSYGGTTDWQWINQWSTPLDRLRFGDFNGDGKTDVFYSELGDDWLVSYGGTTPLQRINTLPAPSLEELRFGDFDW